MDEKTLSSLIEEMKELIVKINKANYEYYVLDEPTLSDKEWDKLYYRLLDIEKETGVVLKGSPSQKVGGEPLSKFKKVTHSHKLYSLSKAQTIEEIIDWNTRNQNIYSFQEEYSVEYKFDGLSLAITYENGHLKQAATRGNGEIGEDVTEQVKTIRTVPLTINYKGTIIVQGEGIIKLSELENELGSTFFRTHRAYLINLRYLERYSSTDVTLETGETLLLSKQKYQELVKSYLSYIKGADKDEF